MGTADGAAPVVLGVDLGTTFTAAAVGAEGHVEPFSLGTRSIGIASTVFLLPDGHALVGEAAEARGAVEPERLAREFKRRFGDPTPLVLGGTPYGAERLTTILLQAVLSRASERLGRSPDTVVVTHPASFSHYRLELLNGAVRQSGVEAAHFLAEPVAAGLEYAARRPVADGEAIAVYDLGGGTFDAAVIRREGDQFRIVGNPVGLDRLGGVDFDAGLLDLVNQRLGGALDELDVDDVAVRQALARLRGEVRRAKELLSDDAEVVVPIGIDGLPASVSLARTDVDKAVKPRLKETIDLLDATIRSAELSMPDISRVLLVGGSTRMPIVRRTIAELTERPLATDVDPELAVALGAARSRLRAATTAAPPPPPAVAAVHAGRPAAGPPFAAASADPPRKSIGRRSLLVGTAGLVASAIGGLVVMTRGDESSGPSTTNTPQGSVSPVTTVATGDTVGVTATPTSTDAVGVIGAADLTLSGYTSVRGGVTRQLWVQSGDDGRFVDLGGDVVEAAVAPDGSRIAVVLRQEGRRRLALATITGGTAAVTPLGFSGEAADPAWHPDGTRFVFSGTEATSSNLYLYDVTTGTVSSLEASSSTDKYPAWSPDGSRLSFSSDRTDLVPRLFVLEISTGSITALAPTLSVTRSTWLDARTLVVETAFGESPELAEVSLDGGEPRRITTSSEEERSPVALGGQRGVLAAIGDAQGAYVAVISVDDGSLRRLTEPGTGDAVPSVLTARQIDGLG